MPNNLKGGHNMSLVGKKFIIDAGHGGQYNGVEFPRIDGSLRREKVITLQIAKEVRTFLENKGAYVYMTRTTDVDFGGTNADDDINKRVQFINNNLPASHALVSIHLNTPRGRVGNFYQTGAVASKAFAEEITAVCKPYYSGIGTYADNFAILRETTKANQKVLFEVDNIDNDELDISWPSIIAGLIVKGIENHLG
ncbi:N-acetylmuramoyl-L-alanine amidase [Paenibacillaceae bacterium]|nr:N-acetylmuramoyl-L-alanine amidase [Paenibacillaceae bacterium]